MLLHGPNGSEFRPGSLTYWIETLQKHGFNMERAARDVAVNADEIEEIVRTEWQVKVRLSECVYCPVSETYYRHLRRQERKKNKDPE